MTDCEEYLAQQLQNYCTSDKKRVGLALFIATKAATISLSKANSCLKQLGLSDRLEHLVALRDLAEEYTRHQMEEYLQ